MAYNKNVKRFQQAGPDCIDAFKAELAAGKTWTQAANKLISRRVNIGSLYVESPELAELANKHKTNWKRKRKVDAP